MIELKIHSYTWFNFQVEIADFETLERKFNYVTPSVDLKRILMMIKYNQKEWQIKTVASVNDFVHCSINITIMIA